MNDMAPSWTSTDMQQVQLFSAHTAPGSALILELNTGAAKRRALERPARLEWYSLLIDGEDECDTTMQVFL